MKCDDTWLILRVEEMLDDIHELLAFLPHGNMARFFKGHPLDSWDAIEKWLDHEVLRQIRSPVQQKSGNVDLV